VLEGVHGVQRVESFAVRGPARRAKAYLGPGRYPGCRVAAPPKFRLNPLCAEKLRLRTVYGQAVDLHSKAVEEVLRARGRTSNLDYEGFRAVADQARNARDTARLALDLHKREHGC
jgi:hypothetical protein